MSEAQTPVAIECPQVVIPSADDLEKIIIQIGNQYGWEYIKPIEELLGAFPLSHTWNKVNLDIPELEWEGKIQCIIEEFKLYPIVKICEFLSIPLKIPVPPFGITVDCQRLFTEPGYKAELLKELEESVDISKIMDGWNLEQWDGTNGIDMPDIKLSQAWKELVEEIKTILSKSMFLGIGEILGKSPVKEIVELLPDPIGFLLELIISVPKGGYDFDSEKLFKSLQKQAEEAGEDFKEMLLEFEIPFVSEVPSILGLEDVLPKTIGDLIDLDVSGEFKEIDFPNWDTQKIKNKFDSFIKDLPQILLEACLEKLTKLISFLIPSSIPIPFTLCTFLTAIGFPKEISIDNLVLEGT